MEEGGGAGEKEGKKRKALAGNDYSNLASKSSHMRKKPPSPRHYSNTIKRDVEIRECVECRHVTVWIVCVGEHELRARIEALNT